MSEAPKIVTREDAIAALEKFKQQTAEHVDLLSDRSLSERDRDLFAQMIVNSLKTIEISQGILDQRAPKDGEA